MSLILLSLLSIAPANASPLLANDVRETSRAALVAEREQLLASIPSISASSKTCIAAAREFDESSKERDQLQAENTAFTHSVLRTVPNTDVSPEAALKAATDQVEAAKTKASTAGEQIVAAFTTVNTSLAPRLATVEQEIMALDQRAMGNSLFTLTNYTHVDLGRFNSSALGGSLAHAYPAEFDGCELSREFVEIAHFANL